jgi:predicted aspartyl protease
MKSVFLAAVAALMATAAQAQVLPPAAPAGDLPPDIISTGEDDVARLTVPVMVNGKGPYNFIIDTGSDRSVISRELAEQLAVPKGRKATLHTMGGADEITTVKLDSLQVSSNIIRHLEVPALPRKYLGADGLLGIDSLKNQRVTLDFAAQTMTVEASNTREIRKEVDPGGTIVVTAKSKLGQLVLVDADANGEEVWVVVDTGAQNTVGNTPLRRLMVKRTPEGGFRPVELISVVGDRIPADFTIVGHMRIGGLKINNAAVAFVDAHPFRKFGLQRKPAMLLGMEGLRPFRKVSIDFANRRVKFHLPQGDVGNGGI